MPSPTAARPPAGAVAVGMQPGMSEDGRPLPSVSWQSSGHRPPRLRPRLQPRLRPRPLWQRRFQPHRWSLSRNPPAAPVAAVPPPLAEPGCGAALADHHPQQPLGEIGNLLGAEGPHACVGGLRRDDHLQHFCGVSVGLGQLDQLGLFNHVDH